MISTLDLVSPHRMNAFLLKDGRLLYPVAGYDDGIVSDGYAIAKPGDAEFEAWAEFTTPATEAMEELAQDLDAHDSAD